jgi:hypothetical protein
MESILLACVRTPICLYSACDRPCRYKLVDHPPLEIDPICPVEAVLGLLPPELVIVAKALEYDAFQADTDARTLDGTGAIVRCALEQPAESMDAESEYNGSSGCVRLTAT